MSKSIDEVVERLKFLRTGLIPPYCEDHDEDEKNTDDYRKYFSPRLEECKSDAQRYLTSMIALASLEDGDSAAVEDVLAARARFAASFPFCVDELACARSAQTKSYVDHMVDAYRRDAVNGGLAKSLQEYLALLDEFG